MIEELLRQTLERRASGVEVSEDAWARITGRLDPHPHLHGRRPSRRPRWFVVTAMGAITAIAAVATLLVRVDGGRSQRVSTIAQPSSPTAPTSSPSAAVAPVPVPPPTTAYRASTTTIPVPASSSTAYAGVFPETAAELVRIQQAVDQGSQPWRLDPVSVARAYLATFGIDNPDLQLGPAVAEGELGSTVPYVSGPLDGAVALARLAAGSVYYVTALTTTRLETRRIERQGRTLALEVVAVTGGRLTIRSRAPGGADSMGSSIDLASPDPAVLSVDLGHYGPANVRLRLQSPDGTVHLAEFRVEEGDTGVTDPVPLLPPAPPAALTPDALVRADGIGPVSLGMTIDEVRAAAGVPFSDSDGPHCRSLVADWDPASLPAGFPPRPYDLVFTNDSGGRLDMISVFRSPVATGAGIAVGSTEEDVLQAYPGEIDVRDHDRGSRWLIHRPSDPAMAEYSIVFVVDEGGRVVSYRAGRSAVTEADEPCA